MSTQFLTIKEASERYSKAEITIRRLVRSVVHEKNSPDRDHIHPTVEEAQKLKKKKKPFAYTISVTLLEQKYAVPEVVDTGRKATTGDYLLLMEKTNERLIDQMRVKDEQIRALNESLDALSERQRETNILMKGMQEHYLPQPVLSESKSKRRWWNVGSKATA